MLDDSSPQNAPRLIPDERDPFYQFFHSAPILMAITSFAEGRYIEINRMFLRTLGFSRSMVIGKTSTDLDLWVNPADRENLKRALASSFRAFLPEIRIRTGDGIIRHLIFSAERIEIDGHFCLLTAAQDITNRKHSENVLLHMEKLKAIERIVGSMARDYDQLLSEVSRALDTIRSQLEPGSHGHTGLEKARSVLSEMSELNWKFKTFGRVSPADPQPVAIKPVLEQSVRRAAGETGLSVAFLFSGELPPVVIDAKAFDRMCRALVCNADDAMPDGGTLRVFASAVILESDQVEFGFRIMAGHYVKLSFADTGVGIAEELIPKIFDPYFSTETEPRKKGKGFGLATVYSVVCRYGGCLSVTSKKNAGSLFNIYLPVASDRVEPEDFRLPLRRVLVADDETAFSEKLLTALFEQGVVCDVVGAQAAVPEILERALISGRGYDAVLLGRFPGDEIQSLAQVRAIEEIDPDVCCFAAIEYGTLDYVPDYQRYGFAGVVRKPYNLSNLTAVFRRLTGDNRQVRKRN